MYPPQKNNKIITISLLTIVAGGLVMAGWIWKIPVLQSMGPGLIAMRFNAALCFILFSAALLITQFSQLKYHRRLYFMLAAAGTLVGLVTVFQDVFHFNAGIDQLFVRDPIVPSAKFPHPGRMAFNASFSFLLLGLGFLSLGIKKWSFAVLSQFFFHAVVVLSAIAITGYLYGVSFFNTLLYVTSMAASTAVLFFLLSGAALLLTPSVGIAWLFTGERVGNQMAKRLYILMILMVVFFAALRIQTRRFQLFSTLDIGVSLLAVGFLLVSLVLIWHTAGWLNGIDERRSAAEDKVKQMNASLEKMVEERTAEFKKSEEKYRSLIEQASDAIYVLGLAGNFTDVNNSMCKMMGYSREELLELNIEAIIDPEELKTDPLRKRVNSPGDSVVRERRFIRKDGQVFNVEINVKNFANDRIMVIARDISGRKKMEDELREAELKFRTIADRSMVGVYIVQDGKFVYMNPRFAEVFGYTPEELISSVPVETVIHESFRPQALENIRKRVMGEVESIRYEALGKKKNGDARWVEFYGSNAVIGNKPTIIGSMIDIDERKNAEGLIMREKTLSDKIINSLPGVFYLYNDKYEFLRWNKNFELLTGYTGEEISNIHARDVIAEDDHEKVEEAMETALNFGYAAIEAKAITKTGQTVPFLFTGTPIIYENQRCVLGTGVDISSRITAENELRVSEQKYKFLFDSNPLPLWMVAKDDYAIIAANDAAAKLYGYPKEELLQMRTSDLRHKDDLDQQMEGYKIDIDNSVDRDVVRHFKKDGSLMFIKITANDIIFEGRPVRLSLTNDVTEKLVAEESLQKSEANLQTILKTTDTAYALFDKELKALAFNQKAARFVKEQYGHLPKKGDTFAEHFSLGTSARASDLAEEVLAGNNINYEVDHVQPDGSVLWHYVRLFPITNDNKEILGMLMALYDITERKNAEQDLKNAYERIQTHINSIKDMAWKQSHLIRSPLANLKGLTEMLKDDPSDNEIFEHLQSELHRMDTIIIEMAEDASGHTVNE